MALDFCEIYSNENLSDGCPEISRNQYIIIYLKKQSVLKLN